MSIEKTIKLFKKNQGISMVTCYDYTSALIVESSDIETILVGDSLAMTMFGLPDTIQVHTKDVARHTQYVRSGTSKFITADMPFLSYRKDQRTSLSNVELLMKAGANAVKIEGADGNLELIKHMSSSGIPVMGHLGLTPQFYHQLGGFSPQGKEDKSANKIKQDALSLQEAGCFSIVLECIPVELAGEITRSLSIATIGIGCGSETDAQVLVFQDLLGLNPSFKPKFVKHYLQGHSLFKDALNTFNSEVKAKTFPSAEYTYKN